MNMTIGPTYEGMGASGHAGVAPGRREVFFGLEVHADQEFDWKRWVANWSETTWGALRAVAPNVLAPSTSRR